MAAAHKLDGVYELAAQFADAWNAIVRDVLGLKTYADPAALLAIFVAPGRKLHVGLMLVGLALMYMFVFVSA